MSTIHNCCVAEGASSALSVGIARYKTEKSMDTRKTGSVSTASPSQVRRSGRLVLASDRGSVCLSMMLTGCSNRAANTRADAGVGRVEGATCVRTAIARSWRLDQPEYNVRIRVRCTQSVYSIVRALFTVPAVNTDNERGEGEM